MLLAVQRMVHLPTETLVATESLALMDVDRYVTYPVVRDAWLSLEDTSSLQDAEVILRTALPGILAQHRADVLREAALVLGEKHTLVADERERRGYAAAARQVRRLCNAAEGADGS